MDIIDEIKRILKELSESQRELSESQKETDRKFKETDRKFVETDRKFVETDRELKELGRYLKEQSRMIQGVSDSNGKYAEQFFYTGLLHSRSLNGQAFSSCFEHLKANNIIGGKEIADEFDIVLNRPDALAIVEVKYRLRKDDVEDLVSRKAQNFRTLFSDIANGKIIYLAVAGFSVDAGALKRAKELGVYVLTQKGDAIHLLNDVAKEY